MEDKEERLNDLYNLLGNITMSIKETNDKYYKDMLDSLKTEIKQEINELEGE